MIAITKSDDYAEAVTPGGRPPPLLFWAGHKTRNAVVTCWTPGRRTQAGSHSYTREVALKVRHRAALEERTVWPRVPAFDLKDWLVEIGIPLAGVHSGTLAQHVGSVAQGVAHDALVDSRSLAEAVRYLVGRGAPNPLQQPSR